MVSFQTALVWLKNGKKVRLPTWSKGLYISTEDDSGVIRYKGSGDMMSAIIEAFESEAWEIYGEDEESTKDKLKRIKTILEED